MVIVEGIDGVGKTTVIDYLCNHGLEKYHFGYDANNMDLYNKYISLLKLSPMNKAIDRSFISEMVYGPVVRGVSKLNFDQYVNLLLEYKKVGTTIIYLTAPKDILLERRRNDLKDYELILKFYDQLNLQYEKIMNFTDNYIRVLKLDTFSNSIDDVQNNVRKLVLK